jgi:ketosteroid isomerase-like protein
MSEENVEVVRKAFEGAGTGTLQETAETYWHPEIVYVEDPRWPGASTYKGRDAVLRCFQAYMEDALGREEDMTVTVERVFDGGDCQVPFVRVQSPASTSGVPHEHLWGYVVEVREQRIAYFVPTTNPERPSKPPGCRSSALDEK